MHAATTLLAILALLMTTVFSAASNTVSSFEIKHMQIANSRSTGQTSMHFTVHDPDPLSNATDYCHASWQTNTADYSNSGVYEPCSQNSTFSWRINSYINISSFELGIENAYEDDSIGEYPYNYIANYADVTISQPKDLWCRRARCQQHSGRVIKAPITMTSAKRR